jgi:FMN phosphatase YigB (HAD superfamily)
MRPKLISLDVWNTLISPNPAYAAARDAVLGQLPFDLERTKAIYRDHKDGADRAAEERGEGLSAEATYKKFALAVDPTGDIQPDVLRWMMEEAFIANPPLIEPQVIQALRLAHAKGVKLSIGSNTNFIRGRILDRAALKRFEVPWAFQVFSDVHGVSKPHPEFWQAVRTRAGYLDIAPEEIVHVGDNMICDGGSEAHGIAFRYTPNPAGLPAVIESLLP